MVKNKNVFTLNTQRNQGSFGRVFAPLRLILLSVCLTKSIFAVDKPAEISAKLKSRDQAIHVMGDWMRDPFISKGPDDLFYLSCTRLDHTPGGYQGIEIWRSKDLVKWENMGVPWNTQQSSWLPQFIEKAQIEHSAKKYLLWAPEIWFVDGKWVCVHTSNAQKANLFFCEGKDLKAPFSEPMEERFGHQHDPSLFTDDDGSHWLIARCADIQKLKPDFSGFDGKRIQIGSSDRKMGHEGCQIIKVGGKYVLTGTAWSTDKMRHGTYNLYYCTSDKLTGPYGERKFAGRCLGHGTLFQDNDGKWWCTAFINGTYKKPGSKEYENSNPDTAYTYNPAGLTLVPMSIELKDGDIEISALDPDYAKPGPDEVQKFD